MKAVVIIIEGVGAAMLGPYGSSTSTTPALDRLASQSLVLDQCFLDSFDLPIQLRSLWTATHAATTIDSDWSIWRELSGRGIAAQLVTDARDVAQLAGAFGCERVTHVDVPMSEEAVDDAEQSALMHVFAAAIELLSETGADGLIWIHSRGLRLPWDAPLQLRRAMTDPEDPEPPSGIELPVLELDADSDPDLAIGWGQVAAAQIAMFDEAVEAIEHTIAGRHDADQWSWLVASTGGRPLGEHGFIGRARRLGYCEENAVAALVRPAHAAPVGVRRAELCQLPDLPMTLLTAMGLADAMDGIDRARVWGRNLWHPGPPRKSTDWEVDHSLAWLENEAGIWLRTPAWSLVQPSQGAAQLYVKPDDRWEVSDVATRSSDVVAELESLLPAIRSAHGLGAREQLPRLDESLTSLLR